jgi:hypothetical protein
MRFFCSLVDILGEDIKKVSQSRDLKDSQS